MLFSSVFFLCAELTRFRAQSLKSGATSEDEWYFTNGNKKDNDEDDEVHGDSRFITQVPVNTISINAEQKTVDNMDGPRKMVSFFGVIIL